MDEEKWIYLALQDLPAHLKQTTESAQKKIYRVEEQVLKSIQIYFILFLIFSCHIGFKFLQSYTIFKNYKNKAHFTRIRFIAKINNIQTVHSITKSKTAALLTIEICLQILLHCVEGSYLVNFI